MKRNRTVRKGTNINFFTRFGTLLGQPLFWFLTITGNAMIVLGGIGLFYFESTLNKSLQFIDCLLWSTSLVTTVGYVSLVPQTFFGKILVLVLMMLGTFFIWSYMAFLVAALISPALMSLEKEIEEVEKEISDLKSEDFGNFKGRSGEK